MISVRYLKIGRPCGLENDHAKSYMPCKVKEVWRLDFFADFSAKGVAPKQNPEALGPTLLRTEMSCSINLLLSTLVPGD